MPIWQVLIFALLVLLEGGALTALGVWAGQHAVWRDLKPILDEQNRWMREQEAMNRGLIEIVRDLQMRHVED